MKKLLTLLVVAVAIAVTQQLIVNPGTNTLNDVCQNGFNSFTPSGGTLACNACTSTLLCGSCGTAANTAGYAATPCLTCLRGNTPGATGLCACASPTPVADNQIASPACVSAAASLTNAAAIVIATTADAKLSNQALLVVDAYGTTAVTAVDVASFGGVATGCGFAGTTATPGICTATANGLCVNEVCKCTSGFFGAYCSYTVANLLLVQAQTRAIIASLNTLYPVATAAFTTANVLNAALVIQALASNPEFLDNVALANLQTYVAQASFVSSYATYALSNFAVRQQLIVALSNLNAQTARVGTLVQQRLSKVNLLTWIDDTLSRVLIGGTNTNSASATAAFSFITPSIVVDVLFPSASTAAALSLTKVLAANTASTVTIAAADVTSSATTPAVTATDVQVTALVIQYKSNPFMNQPNNTLKSNVIEVRVMQYGGATNVKVQATTVFTAVTVVFQVASGTSLACYYYDQALTNTWILDTTATFTAATGTCVYKRQGIFALMAPITCPLGTFFTAGSATAAATCTACGSGCNTCSAAGTCLTCDNGLAIVAGTTAVCACTTTASPILDYGYSTTTANLGVIFACQPNSSVTAAAVTAIAYDAASMLNLAYQTAYTTASLTVGKPDLLTYNSLCGATNCSGNVTNGNCTLAGCACSSAFGDSHCIVSTGDALNAQAQVLLAAKGLQTFTSTTGFVYGLANSKQILAVMLAITIAQDFVNTAVLVILNPINKAIRPFIALDLASQQQGLILAGRLYITAGTTDPAQAKLARTDLMTAVDIYFGQQSPALSGTSTAAGVFSSSAVQAAFDNGLGFSFYAAPIIAANSNVFGSTTVVLSSKVLALATTVLNNGGVTAVVVHKYIYNPYATENMTAAGAMTVVSPVFEVRVAQYGPILAGTAVTRVTPVAVTGSTNGLTTADFSIVLPIVANTNCAYWSASSGLWVTDATISFVAATGVCSSSQLGAFALVLIPVTPPASSNTTVTNSTVAVTSCPAGSYFTATVGTVLAFCTTCPLSSCGVCSAQGCTFCKSGLAPSAGLCDCTATAFTSASPVQTYFQASASATATSATVCLTLAAATTAITGVTYNVADPVALASQSSLTVSVLSASSTDNTYTGTNPCGANNCGGTSQGSCSATLNICVCLTGFTGSFCQLSTAQQTAALAATASAVTALSTQFSATATLTTAQQTNAINVMAALTSSPDLVSPASAITINALLTATYKSQVGVAATTVAATVAANQALNAARSGTAVQAVAARALANAVTDTVLLAAFPTAGSPVTVSLPGMTVISTAAAATGSTTSTISAGNTAAVPAGAFTASTTGTVVVTTAKYSGNPAQNSGSKTAQLALAADIRVSTLTPTVGAVAASSTDQVVTGLSAANSVVVTLVSTSTVPTGKVVGCAYLSTTGTTAGTWVTDATVVAVTTGTTTVCTSTHLTAFSLVATDAKTTFASIMSFNFGFLAMILIGLLSLLL